VDGPEPVVRVVRPGPEDAAALAGLRARWTADAEADASLVRRMAEWLELEGPRRTVWLVELDGVAIGMATLFEYRRMPRPDRPDTCWGYLGTMFVVPEHRGRGIGADLLRSILSVADARGYVRVVLAPSERARPFYERAGFLPADGGDDGGELLLVRAGQASSVRSARSTSTSATRAADRSRPA
jgi:GNAT superfamily N-acetyltransferase